MKSGARMTKDSMAVLRRSVEDLAKQRVLVGIPSDEATRVNDDGSVSPINNAALGYLVEHGSPANNTPERPFLVPGVQESLPQANPRIGKAGSKMLAGDPAGAEKEFHAVGLIAQASVKRKMNVGPFAKLADSTLAARRRRGVTRTTPTVDTANLQAHITYVVRKK
jgi:hypothetical protein